MIMPAATFIARLVGPLFAALGLGLLLNATFYAAAVGEGAHSPVLIAIAGMATLVAGLAILNAYRAWTADWRVLVTVIGWIFIIAGLIRLILPTLAETLAPAVYSGPAALMVAGVVVLIVGGILSFEGYRTAIK
ncbi:MAG TPA: hypothetical protein VN938_13195 [Xanthobacteraceae bacterium]|jgi:hypothetical protein|nr:hypothetical protein [Xanthobacteraceae bacterium]